MGRTYYGPDGRPNGEPYEVIKKLPLVCENKSPGFHSPAMRVSVNKYIDERRNLSALMLCVVFPFDPTQLQ